MGIFLLGFRHSEIWLQFCFCFCCSDSGFVRKGEYDGSRSSSSAKREYEGGTLSPPRESELDGLTPFEKNFYAESPAVASMSESEVEEYRQRREITVDGKNVPNPVKSFSDVNFPGTLRFSFMFYFTIIRHKLYV